MIRRAVQFRKILWRPFCSSTEELAKQELKLLIASSHTKKSKKGEPLKHVKLVESSLKNEDANNEMKNWIVKEVQNLKTVEAFSKFIDENKEIALKEFNLLVLDQIFSIYKRLKRAGSPISLDHFLQQPVISTVFQEILGFYKDINISQLAALVFTLYKNQYYNLDYFIQIEDHLAKRQHDLKFMMSLHNYLRVLATLKDAGMPLSMEPVHLNQIVNRQLPFFKEMPSSKLAGVIFSYHKLMVQLSEQISEKKIRSNYQSLADLKSDDDSKKETLFSEPQVETDIKMDKPKNKKKTHDVKKHFKLNGIELIDFGALLEERVENFDVQSLTLILNSYSLIKEGENHPIVQRLAKKLLSSVELTSVKNIVEALKACVNVGIKSPQVFKMILERSTELLTVLEQNPEAEFDAKDWLMIHYFLVKFEVG